MKHHGTTRDAGKQGEEESAHDRFLIFLPNKMEFLQTRSEASLVGKLESASANFEVPCIVFQGVCFIGGPSGWAPSRYALFEVLKSCKFQSRGLRISLGLCRPFLGFIESLLFESAH